MENLQANEIHVRLEALMARRQAKRALKFVTTNHAKHSMEYELQGDL